MVMRKFTVIEGDKGREPTLSNKPSTLRDAAAELIHQNQPPCRPVDAEKSTKRAENMARLRRSVAKLQAASQEQRDVMREHRETISELKEAWADLKSTTDQTVKIYRGMDLESATENWKSTARAFGRVAKD